MWKYINSNELYHAWPKGYKKGPDGTPLGYVSKDSRYNDKERGIAGKISGNINTFKPKSTNYKVNTSGYKVNISDKKEKPPYEVVSINKNEVVPINKNKEEPEIEKFNPTLDDIFDTTNENITKKGKEKVDNMFKNEKVDFDFTTEKGKKKVNDLINKIRKENAEKERLAKEKAAKEKAEKERLAKEKAEKEKTAKEKAEKEKTANEKITPDKIKELENWDLTDEEINEITEEFKKEEAAKEKAEKERLAKEKAAKEKAEKERLAKEKEAKEKAEKERLAKEKEAKEKAEKERLAKEKETKESENKDLANKYESETKKRDLGLEMQSIKNKQEQQKLDAATADEKRKDKDFKDRKAREAYLDELNRYSNASNNFGIAGSRLGSAGDTVSKIRVQEKEKLDLSQFSSEELKRRIERNRLEQEYNDRFAPETRVSKGKRLVTNILYGSSALSNFAGSIASIMGAIKSFKTLSDYKK